MDKAMEQAIKQQVRQITLRKAHREDAKFLFALRNDVEAFKYYKTPRAVTWDEHIKWFQEAINSQYVIMLGKERAGQLRLRGEGDDGKAIVSVSLSKEQRGKGLGTLGLQEGIRLAKQLGFKELVAEIHQDNLASLKLFQKLGFVFNKAQAPWQTYLLKI
ncbi:MAG: GNAT family N-acetyltransferase [bacterium]|nr:GNAT family N-acetyltransferase [bacterium]